MVQALPAAAEASASAQNLAAAVRGEAGDYAAAMALTDPEMQGAALEAFVAQYPDSRLKAQALEKAMAAYLVARDLDKVNALSTRLLAIRPDDARARAMLVFVLRTRSASAPPAQASVLAEQAGANAERGLNALSHWQAEDDASPGDAAAVRSEISAIFQGALGYRALVRKDYADAAPYYLAAVHADPSGLDDTYQLAIALLQASPPDPAGFWWAARAQDLATAAGDQKAQSAIEAYAKARYLRYHGADDWSTLLAQAQTGFAPPEGFVIAPAASPASVAVQAVHDSPISSLSFSDWEFILAQRDASPENHQAAEKVWAYITALQDRGLKMKFHVKVIGSNPRQLDVAITDDNQQGNHADLHINLAVSGASFQPGSTVSVTGVLTGYIPSPFAFTMEQADIAAGGGS